MEANKLEIVSNYDASENVLTLVDDECENGYFC